MNRREQANAIDASLDRATRGAVARSVLISTRAANRIYREAVIGSIDDAIIAYRIEMVETLTASMLAADGMAMVDAVREAGLLMLATAQEAAIEAARKRLQLTDAEVEAIAEKYGMHAIRIYTEEMRLDGVQIEDALRSAVADSLAQGDHVEAGMQRIESVFDKYGLRAKTHTLEQIMRTQTAMAYSAGADAIDRMPAIDAILWGYEYVAVGDDRTRPGHAALDGTRLPKDDPRWAEITPPNGYNSVPGWTRVLTADGWKPIGAVQHGEMVVTHRGRLRPVIERHLHEGPDELVSIELSDRPGIALWATHNHPVLTKRGWVDSTAVECGDEVLCPFRLLDGVVVGDVDDRAADGDCDLGVTIDARLRLIPLDLDCERDRWYPEVQPERRDAAAELEGQTDAHDEVGKGPLSAAHCCSRVGVPLGALAEQTLAAGCALGHDDRVVERGGSPQLLADRPAPFGIHGVRDLAGLARALDLDIVGFEDTPRCPELDSAGAPEIRERRSARFILGEEGAEAAGPCGIDTRFGPGAVSLRPMGLGSHGATVGARWVTVERVTHVPWGRLAVHNLAVDEDESYIAEGVAVHNCRCKRLRIFVGDREAEPLTPEPFEIEDDDGGTTTVPARPDEGWSFRPSAVVDRV